MHFKYIHRPHRAPEGWDVIRIEKTDEGKYQVSGERAPSGTDPLPAKVYDTHEDATAAGRHWAQENGAEIVYVEIDPAEV